MQPFYIQEGNVFAVPVLHYNMESAAAVKLAFQAVLPDCIAVELPETLQPQLIHAASRLPDISALIALGNTESALYYMCEPCDPAFEALRSGLETQTPTFCIDLDVEDYPQFHDPMPDSYAIQRIGLQKYFESYEKESFVHHAVDQVREMYMAQRLKELSFSYDRILFICGMTHLRSTLNLIRRSSFPKALPAKRTSIELCTVTEESCREILAEYGWITHHYELARRETPFTPPDRQRLLYALYKKASVNYMERTGHPFPGYHMRNLMKYGRNYARIIDRLIPDLFQTLTVAKGCVDHNYAYETWLLATTYPYLKNIDNLPERNLTAQEVWKNAKLVRFHLKAPSRKGLQFNLRPRDKSHFKFEPPNIGGICSFPPEDPIVENFGNFLKKKGRQVLLNETSRTMPFSTSLEEGIDTKETLHHWAERKLYVKTKGKPPGAVGSIVMIFDEDASESNEKKEEHYPWCATWHGEHHQESDMAFYATSLFTNIIGPGISRCEYGGFLLSYPPQRMLDVWSDLDYSECRTKAEVLLMAGIDYTQQHVVVYVAEKPPRTIFKSFAQRYGKKIVYVPKGQLSPITLERIRIFHVLDSKSKRSIASEYIF